MSIRPVPVIRACVLAFLITAGAQGCIVAARPAPPPPRAEIKPAPLHKNSKWIPGHYKWMKGKKAYIWVPGHWS